MVTDMQRTAFLESEIVIATQQMNRLKTRISVLQEMLIEERQGRLGTQPSENAHSEPVETADREPIMSERFPQAGCGPKGAVLRLLMRDPKEGWEDAELVDVLESRIRSKSDKKKRVLHSTIYNLIEKGLLRRSNENKEVFLTEKGLKVAQDMIGDV